MVEQLQARIAELQAEIARKQGNPFAAQQIADRQREIEGIEFRIKMLNK